MPLGREPEYEGLSYCWGDPQNAGSIYCNGMPLPIGANLMSALVALRKEDQPRLLWIDAVCINQGSIAERNQQVALMRDIYSNARRTVVWLGPEENGSNDALAIIPALLAIRAEKSHGRGNRSGPRGVRSRFSLSPEEMEANPDLERAIQDPEVRIAFLNILQRPWFSRAWIIQEITVCPETTVVCGSVEVSFDDLA